MELQNILITEQKQITNVNRNNMIKDLPQIVHNWPGRIFEKVVLEIGKIDEL